LVHGTQTVGADDRQLSVFGFFDKIRVRLAGYPRILAHPLRIDDQWPGPVTRRIFGNVVSVAGGNALDIGTGRRTFGRCARLRGTSHGLRLFRRVGFISGRRLLDIGGNLPEPVIFPNDIDGESYNADKDYTAAQSGLVTTPRTFRLRWPPLSQGCMEISTQANIRAIPRS